MKKLNNFGYILSVLFPMTLFLSYKGEQTLGYIISALFLITMFSEKNRNSLKALTDNKLSLGVSIFVIVPFVISLFSGGLFSRVDTVHYFYWLIFFPLVYFIDNEKKLWYFLISFLVGGIISLIITLIIFIKNYNEWANPSGFEYPRVYFAIQTQDFANIMCILFLFLLSFIFFYKNKDRRKNFIIKSFLICISLLNLFIIIVNRSKMVYICLIPTVVYILYKKNKRYILGFFFLCLGGYFLLPQSISQRLQYIIKYRQDPSSNLRILFWEAAIASSKKSPFFGMSTEKRIKFNINHFKSEGVIDYIAKNYGLDEVGITNTHSMYLHYLANYGMGILSLIYFLFWIVPSRLFKFNYYKIQDISLSHYTALEIGLKASYFAYLIQGITEFNLNKKPMIFVFVIILVVINFISKDFSDKK
ncbi:O-antigen ligase domain-containing protein [Leptotrichia sp. OH3620_COT-345]|uniref:O-antigen ligase family protein n=1 Tax=Leptotrichia sp. OH3620_COT-345 TaxID=2491048 RepID=UPI000F650A63|nr:O-antigen ligase family protein [Leptotrichia sp. OH3620_COT-345]RRD40772.1 O-antigen ligase domain-containing protein [Leptotrichia sp. OH3620_COT-345]